MTRLNAKPTMRASGASEREKRKQIRQLGIRPVQWSGLMSDRRRDGDRKARGDQGCADCARMPGFQHDGGGKKCSAHRNAVDRGQTCPGRACQEDLAVALGQRPSRCAEIAEGRGELAGCTFTAQGCARADDQHLQCGVERHRQAGDGPMVGDGLRQLRHHGTSPQHPPAEPRERSADHRADGTSNRATAGDAGEESAERVVVGQMLDEAQEQSRAEPATPARSPTTTMPQANSRARRLTQ